MDVSRPIPDNQVLKVEPALPGLELSARINAVLGRLRDQRGNYPTCFVVRQGAQAPAPRDWDPARQPPTPSFGRDVLPRVCCKSCACCHAGGVVGCHALTVLADQPS